VKTERLTMRLPSVLRDKLEQLALADRRSLSDYICMKLQDHIGHLEQERQ
jgi:hypothetical protein